MTPIARLPTYEAKDEWCAVCDDDNIVIVLNGVNTNMPLCSKCYYRMQCEIKEMNIEQANR